MRCSAKGFTLIEIITVIAIIGVLAAVLTPNIGSWVGKSKLRTGADELQQLLAFMKGESLSRGTTIKAEISEDDNSIAIYSSNESTTNCQSSEVEWSIMSNNLVFNNIKLISEVENDELCFFTNGSSNGGKLTLSSKHGEYEVQVLSATAFIEKRKIE
ncbi:MAG TPA: prepilin-type N-terminal cleavage/methylation domain-containing protein [Piscirickettsiaceae bacterium]|jgi:type II secretion system protein H|nr:prepilin-type N-terminal cleavage/methylation domain-containing protein [Piscirickettsiaceae bacterium]